MAIVPLLLIKTKVMMAIRMRGIFLPNRTKAKTSLGFGQGSVVDIRTVMYEIKKELNMNVSLSRKIHIMALPQGTFLNARWSEDQPNPEQVVPVEGAQLHAVPDLRHVEIAPHFRESPAPGNQTSQQMQPVQSRDQIKKSDRGVRNVEINHRPQLSPGQYLPDQKNDGESAARKKSDSHAVHLPATR